MPMAMLLQEPTVISGDVRVDSYSATGNLDGNIAAWFSSERREPGLYVADVNLIEPPLLVDEEGVLPNLRFDGQWYPSCALGSLSTR